MRSERTVLKLSHLQHRPKIVFDIAKADRIFDICKTDEEAIASFLA